MLGVAIPAMMVLPRAARCLIHLVGRYPITLAAQFLDASSDRRKIICGAGSGHLAQFLYSSSDHLEIIGGAGSGHGSSGLFVVRVAITIAG
jgi:hypothetical protein